MLDGDNGRDCDNLIASTILEKRTGVPCFWADSPIDYLIIIILK